MEKIDKYLEKYGTLKDGIKHYSAKDIRGIFEEESNQVQAKVSTIFTEEEHRIKERYG